MAFFRCRAFLCCVPLRTGVWLLGLIAMIVSALGAAGSWLEVTWMSNHPLALRDKVAIMIEGIVLSSLFLLALFGFIAALKGARGAVYIYSKFIFIHTGLILLSFGFTLFSILRPDKSNPVENCLNGSTSRIIAQFCGQGLSLVRILSAAFLGVSVLVQFYAWIVSISYAEELDVDITERERFKYFGSDSDLERNPSSSNRFPEPPFARR
ncbi:hypothetical protein DFH07DRAFT_20932 [Mycena maculata]|uniref:Uncharacterized protein n=1 Tax=Mycena maculata TaxID=230809 RepID=A0AAD7N4C2_9AGAR|nr:hypothetical protein DFH07DRAFT_20932 [Mycena maculata]